MKNYKRGFLTVLTWVIVALIVAGLGTWVYIKQAPKKSILTEATTTIGWNTFKSSIFDYEIKYPSTYKVTAGSGTMPDDIEYVGCSNDKNYVCDLQIFARNEDFITKSCLKDLDGNDITNTRDINGVKFYVFKEKSELLSMHGTPIPGTVGIDYQTMHNNSCYIIRYNVSPTYSSYAPDQVNSRFETLDQIFSTFKFTK